MLFRRAWLKRVKRRVTSCLRVWETRSHTGQSTTIWVPAASVHIPSYWSALWNIHTFPCSSVSPFMWRWPVTGSLELAKAPWLQPLIQTESFLCKRQSLWCLTGTYVSCWLILSCWPTLWRYTQPKTLLYFRSGLMKINIGFPCFPSFPGTRRGRTTKLPGSLHCQWDGEPLWPLWSQLVLQSTQSGSELLQPAERRKPAHSSCNGSLPHRLRSQFNLYGWLGMRMGSASIEFWVRFVVWFWKPLRTGLTRHSMFCAENRKSNITISERLKLQQRSQYASNFIFRPTPFSLLPSSMWSWNTLQATTEMNIY